MFFFLSFSLVPLNPKSQVFKLIRQACNGLFFCTLISGMTQNSITGVSSDQEFLYFQLGSNTLRGVILLFGIFCAVMKRNTVIGILCQHYDK